MKGWLGGSLCTRLNESGPLIEIQFQVTLIEFLIRIVMTRHRLVQVIEKSSEPASPQPALAFQEHNWIDFY